MLIIFSKEYDFCMEEKATTYEEVLNKRKHLKNVCDLINFYYPEGVVDDLDRCPAHVKQYIRDVANANGPYAYRPELEEDEKNYWAKNSNDESLQSQIIKEYVQGYNIHDLSIRHNWPTSRLRTLLINEEVYVRNRYLYVLEPQTSDKEWLMFDTLSEVCEVLKISPSQIHDIIDTIFKNWHVRKRDLVQELYEHTQAKRRYHF